MLRFWLNGSKEEVEYVNYIYSTPSYPSRFIMLIVKKKNCTVTLEYLTINII
jgi:hypothetical protein